MMSSSDSFIAVEYCDDIETERCDEIAVVIFGIAPNVEPKLHKLAGWLKIAARLSLEELDLISSILNEIVSRIKLSPGNVFGMRQFENTIRIQGPFPAEKFHANYKSRILSQ